jgi:sphingomyelin phosphodiesterase acid-like 3
LRPAVRPHALAFRSLWATLGDITVALAAVLVISLSAPVWGSETEAVAPTRFLMMSDIHFDPMADPKFVDRLSSTEPEEWRAIFESSDSKSPARYGADSNWALLHSALGQAKQALPDPAFIVLPGDFLPHNFRYRFDVSAADHSDAAHRLFVRKTMLLLVL